jgi:hypothetical protein
MFIARELLCVESCVEDEVLVGVRGEYAPFVVDGAGCVSDISEVPDSGVAATDAARERTHNKNVEKDSRSERVYVGKTGHPF